jgi:hypothetical protein
VRIRRACQRVNGIGEGETTLSWNWVRRMRLFLQCIRSGRVGNHNFPRRGMGA